MERLTEHHVSGKGAYMKCSVFCTTAPDGTLAKCDDCEKLDDLVDRLAAYEDTGLEPEEVMKLAQASDVEPVRHGRWSADKFGNLWCSSCKHCGSTDGIDTDFCPNCGAKMDEKAEEK